MKDYSTDKTYLNEIFKSIFEKSADKKNTGGKELELFVKHRINAYKIDESLEAIIENIKKELLDNNSPYKQQILHGNLRIFEILFYIINSYNVSEKIYFKVLSVLFKLLNDSTENDKVLVMNVANTLIKLIRGKRKLCIIYFQYLFESLIFLYLHNDIEIRNYGYALDELLKDEVSNLFQEDYSTPNNNITKSSNSINDNEQTIKFPIKYMIGKWGENKHPALKILIISWITFLESITEIKIINYMDKIVPELFNLLCFQTKDVYQSSEYCLKKILCDIESQYESLSCEYPEIINEILEAVTQNCNKLDEKIKICSFEWLEMILKKIKSILENSKCDNDEQKLNEYLYKNTCENNYIRGTIIPQMKFVEEKNKEKNNDDVNNYKTLKEIVHKNNKLLLKLGLMEKNEKKKKLSTELLIKNIPHKLFSEILKVILYNTLNSSISSISEYIEHCNQMFKFIIANYPPNLLEKDLENIEKILLIYLSKNLNDKSIYLISDWTNQLYNQFGEQLFQNEEEYIKKLINIIPQNREKKNILLKIMNTLCLICEKQPYHIDFIINLIIEKFSKSQNLINFYVIKILKSLSKTVNIFTIFKIFCENLIKNKDLYFVIKITKMLNMFLLGEKECQNIRNELLSRKRTLSMNNINENTIEESTENNLFEKIFYIWSLSPFLAVLLCMYCKYFELSYYLTLELSKLKLKQSDYIELCQIVQIFESSIFNNIRIKLINPKKNIYLVKTLYALLMLLPQSNSFDSLNNRIKIIKSISKIDDEEDDILYEKEKALDYEINPENKKTIINKYIKIMKERYQEKIEYEKKLNQDKN